MDSFADSAIAVDTPMHSPVHSAPPSPTLKPVKPALFRHANWKRDPNFRPHFLNLPTELRLQIYSYCLAETNTLTISAAPLTIFGNQIKDLSRPTPIPGLPEEYVPVIRSGFHRELLDISNPRSIELSDHPGMLAGGEKADQQRREKWEKLPYPGKLALQRTCRKIKEEVDDLFTRNEKKHGQEKGKGSGVDLYLTYPYGILVLEHLHPFLLRHARHAYISGYYTPPPPSSTTSESHNHLTQTNQDMEAPVRRIPSLYSSRAEHTRPPRLSLSLETIEAAESALRTTIRTLLGPISPTSFTHLHARLYYPSTSPSDNSYRTVWSDDRGPVPLIMYNTCGGEIDTVIYRAMRGSCDSAVEMKVRPNPRVRHVSSVWSDLPARRGECEGWVVGEEWGRDG